MKKPRTVSELEKLGRVRLSKSFYMRDFLHSEISQIERIPNIPDEPDIAIEAGKRLCTEVLEPLQEALGKISIRSAYRSQLVNAKGAENGSQYNCASNERNYSRHIWDVPDKNGKIGAVACIVVNSFLPFYETTNHWQALAWWVHDHIEAYSTMCFFPNLCAFNIGWHETPEKRIDSYIKPKGCLTKPGMANFAGSHADEYSKFLQTL